MQHHSLLRKVLNSYSLVEKMFLYIKGKMEEEIIQLSSDNPDNYNEITIITMRLRFSHIFHGAAHE